MTRPSLKHTLFAAAAGLTLLKLWLMRGQPVFGIGGASIDDRLFLELARSLLNGDWLGSYNALTLSKGPFYSIWIAGSYLCGVPLRLSEQLLYVAGCGLLVWAFAPAIKSYWVRFGLYSLVLLNPMTWDEAALGRILRQNIYTPLALAVFACAVALVVRAGERFREVWGWTLGLGVSYACFWLTREESIWFAPSLCLLGGAAVFYAWRRAKAAGLVSLAALSLSTACAALVPILIVCSLNLKHYGWFGTVEFKSAAFNDAYGALLRVTPKEQYPFVPVSRETRLRVYEVSPAFAELKPFLEGDIGGWGADCSVFLTGLPSSRKEIAGGWFMWCLREAAVRAGHGSDARETLSFFRRMADEVNAACEAGKIEGGSRRSGFLPPLRDGQLAQLAKTFGTFSDYFASFRGFSAFAPPSEGGPELLQLFRQLTLERMSVKGYEDPELLPVANRLNIVRVKALQSVGKSLRMPLFVATLAAHILGLTLLVRALVRREVPVLLVAAIAAWGGAAATLLVNALVQVTSFPTLTLSSFAQGYPLLLVFVALVFAETARVWNERKS